MEAMQVHTPAALLLPPWHSAPHTTRAASSCRWGIIRDAGERRRCEWWMCERRGRLWRRWRRVTQAPPRRPDHRPPPSPPPPPLHQAAAALPPPHTTHTSTTHPQPSQPPHPQHPRPSTHRDTTNPPLREKNPESTKIPQIFSVS